MAQFDPTPYPFPEYDNSDPVWKRQADIQDCALDAIPEDRLLKFEYAEDHAYYYMKSFKPTVSQPVPYGDCWQVNPRLIARMTVKDAKDNMAGCAGSCQFKWNCRTGNILYQRESKHIIGSHANRHHRWGRIPPRGNLHPAIHP